MAASRTWNLRLNLDDFNALTSSLYADADRALVLQGMSLGLNGGAMPDGAPPAFCRGWDLGHSMRVEAEEFRTAQAERGQKSAAKRLERDGTAQPRKPGQDRTELEPPFEPPFEPGLEPPVEPNHNPQSTILEATNDQPLPPQSPRGEGRAAPVRSEDVEAIYQAYPRKEGKKAALEKIRIALRSVPFDQLLEAVQAYAAAVSRWPADARQYVPHPATWFTQGRWADDRTTWDRRAAAGRQGAPSTRAFADQQYIELNLRGGSNAAHLASSAPLHDPRFDDLE